MVYWCTSLIRMLSLDEVRFLMRCMFFSFTVDCANTNSHRSCFHRGVSLRVVHQQNAVGKGPACGPAGRQWLAGDENVGRRDGFYENDFSGISQI